MLVKLSNRDGLRRWVNLDGPAIFHEVRDGHLHVDSKGGPYLFTGGDARTIMEALDQATAPKFTPDVGPPQGSNGAQPPQKPPGAGEAPGLSLSQWLQCQALYYRGHRNDRADGLAVLLNRMASIVDEAGARTWPEARHWTMSLSISPVRGVPVASEAQAGKVVAL